MVLLRLGNKSGASAVFLLLLIYVVLLPLLAFLTVDYGKEKKLLCLFQQHRLTRDKRQETLSLVSSFLCMFIPTLLIVTKNSRNHQIDMRTIITSQQKIILEDFFAKGMRSKSKQCDALHEKAARKACLEKAVVVEWVGNRLKKDTGRIDESTIYVKALCQASMKNHRYEVYACLTQRPSGDTIDYAFCQCPVGLAQSCSHVGGLLFTLRNAKTSDAANEQQQSCTSMLCQWKVPRSSLKPQPLKTLKPYKPRLSDSKDRAPPPQTDFDPRHSDDRNTDLGRSLQHLQKLRSVFPNTGMTLLWNIPDDVPAANQEVEVTTMVNPMYSRMENMLFTENNVPPAEIDIELVNFIETSTRGQRLSEMWRKLHIGRLTSSIFGDVLGIKSQPNSLVKRIMEGSCLESDGKVTEEDSVGLLEIKCPFSLNGINVSKMEKFSKHLMELEKVGVSLCCFGADRNGNQWNLGPTSSTEFISKRNDIFTDFQLHCMKAAATGTTRPLPYKKVAEGKVLIGGLPDEVLPLCFPSQYGYEKLSLILACKEIQVIIFYHEVIMITKKKSKQDASALHERMEENVAVMKTTEQDNSDISEIIEKEDKSVVNTTEQPVPTELFPYFSPWNFACSQYHYISKLSAKKTVSITAKIYSLSIICIKNLKKIDNKIHETILCVILYIFLSKHIMESEICIENVTMPNIKITAILSDKQINVITLHQTSSTRNSACNEKEY
ncbi:hypothetical protein KUTeg_013858 [Tegillarca granosa]|uniref:SWIM-type domain-containing protein n=1 Tax=Tegillarca granosa TaxID=220873 RepID=A0ABQ9EVA3_TEGGR|nr:hypothetical protein KUTeg_013858 [Tegillarca granosa]